MAASSNWKYKKHKHSLILYASRCDVKICMKEKNIIVWVSYTTHFDKLPSTYCAIILNKGTCSCDYNTNFCTSYSYVIPTEASVAADLLCHLQEEIHLKANRKKNSVNRHLILLTFNKEVYALLRVYTRKMDIQLNFKRRVFSSISYLQ